MTKKKESITKADILKPFSGKETPMFQPRPSPFQAATARVEDALRTGKPKTAAEIAKASGTTEATALYLAGTLAMSGRLEAVDPAKGKKGKRRFKLTRDAA